MSAFCTQCFFGYRSYAASSSCVDSSTAKGCGSVSASHLLRSRTLPPASRERSYSNHSRPDVIADSSFGRVVSRTSTHGLSFPRPPPYDALTPAVLQAFGFANYQNGKYMKVGRYSTPLSRRRC